jgi:hypothetical protein
MALPLKIADVPVHSTFVFIDANPFKPGSRMYNTFDFMKDATSIMQVKDCTKNFVRERSKVWKGAVEKGLVSTTRPNEIAIRQREEVSLEVQQHRAMELALEDKQRMMRLDQVCRITIEVKSNVREYNFEAWFTDTLEILREKIASEVGDTRFLLFSDGKELCEEDNATDVVLHIKKSLTLVWRSSAMYFVTVHGFVFSMPPDASGIDLYMAIAEDSLGPCKTSFFIKTPKGEVLLPTANSMQMKSFAGQDLTYHKDERATVDLTLQIEGTEEKVQVKMGREQILGEALEAVMPHFPDAGIFTSRRHLSLDGPYNCEWKLPRKARLAGVCTIYGAWRM